MSLRLGLGLGIANGGGAAAAPAFDPATLTLTGWWRASYAGSPWAPTASAGTSGANGNLTEATNPPAVGAALNGFTPADFDGTNDVLNNANAATTFVTESAGTVIVLFYADAASVDASYTNNPGLFVCNSAGLYINYSTIGFEAGCFDTGHASAAVAASTGAWHMGVARWNGATIGASVDGGAFTTTPSTGPSLLASAVRVGTNWSQAALFNGQIAEVMTMAASISDADVANVKSYLESRYGLAL